jgi:DNA processing protein
VFAIPGSIHSPVARGCHSLIRQGAKLVESSQDIIDELPASLAAQLSPAALPKPTDQSSTTAELPEMLRAVLDLLDWDGMTMEQLQMSVDADQSALHTAENLLELELAGLVERLPDGRVRRRAAPH